MEVGSAPLCSCDSYFLLTSREVGRKEEEGVKKKKSEKDRGSERRTLSKCIVPN